MCELFADEPWDPSCRWISHDAHKVLGFSAGLEMSQLLTRTQMRRGHNGPRSELHHFQKQSMVKDSTWSWKYTVQIPESISSEQLNNRHYLDCQWSVVQVTLTVCYHRAHLLVTERREWSHNLTAIKFVGETWDFWGQVWEKGKNEKLRNILWRGTEAGAQGGKCMGGGQEKGGGMGEMQKNYKILHNTFQSK